MVPVSIVVVPVVVPPKAALNVPYQSCPGLPFRAPNVRDTTVCLYNGKGIYYFVYSSYALLRRYYFRVNLARAHFIVQREHAARSKPGEHTSI
jgi:hypothetical protein